MLKPKTWLDTDRAGLTEAVLTMAVEEGVALGYHLAHQLVDQPDEQQLRQAIEEAVMGPQRGADEPAED
jgi:hypothetical protein